VGIWVFPAFGVRVTCLIPRRLGWVRSLSRSLVQSPVFDIGEPYPRGFRSTSHGRPFGYRVPTDFLATPADRFTFAVPKEKGFIAVFGLGGRKTAPQWKRAVLQSIGSFSEPPDFQRLVKTLLDRALDAGPQLPIIFLMVVFMDMSAQFVIGGQRMERGLACCW
jgi:hypothetical protein